MNEFDLKLRTLVKLKGTGIKSSVELLALAPVDFIYCIPDLSAEEFSCLCEIYRRVRDGSSLFDYLFNTDENLKNIEALKEKSI